MQMENYSGIVISSMEDEYDDHEMELPPGFRFHPTDEELITHYLSQKYLNNNFNAVAIGEADLNKIEPWELPKKAKWGEKEWYFFCVRDRKYPSGVRTNRATEAGYWKATGKDKEIYNNKKNEANGKILVGMKKTLVFYTGRAPRGQKSNWVMHEYRLEKQPHRNFVKNEWVISRVFEKNSGTKKLNDSGSMSMSPSDVEGSLPPLTDSSSFSPKLACHANSSSHIMTCFSNPLFMVEEDQLNPTTKKTEEHDDDFDASSSLSYYYSTKSSSLLANMFIDDETPDFGFFDSIFAHDQPMMKLLLDGKASVIKDELSEDEIRLKYNNNGGGEMNNNYTMNSGSNGLDCLCGY